MDFKMQKCRFNFSTLIIFPCFINAKQFGCIGICQLLTKYILFLVTFFPIISTISILLVYTLRRTS